MNNPLLSIYPEYQHKLFVLIFQRFVFHAQSKAEEILKISKYSFFAHISLLKDAY